MGDVDRYEKHLAYQRRYAIDHRTQRAATKKRWCEAHPATQRLLNKRLHFVRKSCMDFVRQHYPEVYARFQKQAKGAWPACMVDEEGADDPRR